MNKGDYGYMDRYKKRHMIGVAIYAVIIAAAMIASKFVSGEMVSAILVVIAIVLVLPAAKHLIAVIVVFPYHTLDKVNLQDLEEHTTDIADGVTIYDVTLASTDIIMYTPYIYMLGDRLYCLVTDKTNKNTVSTVKSYINKILLNSGLPMEVTCCGNVSEMNKALEELTIPENLTDADRKLLDKAKEQILIYNV